MSQTTAPTPDSELDALADIIAAKVLKKVTAALPAAVAGDAQVEAEQPGQPTEEDVKGLSIAEAMATGNTALILAVRTRLNSHAPAAVEPTEVAAE